MGPREIRRLPAHVRRAALEALARDRLSEITAHYELSVEDGRVTDHHVVAIMRSRSIDFAEILESLSREELKRMCQALNLDDGGREKAPLIDRIMALSEPSAPETRPAHPEAKAPVPGTSAPLNEPPPPHVTPLGTPAISATSGKDPKKVFIIHGRQQAILQELKHFLAGMGLQAWTFDDEIHDAPHNSSILEVITRGVSKTRAVIALLTPDEFACLVPDLRAPADSERDVRRWQPRPNVIYEAGMAMALNREGTVLVTVGRVDLPSDLDGVLHIRMSNHSEDRRKLRRKLIHIGGAVDNNLEDWMGESQGGDFSMKQLTMPSDPYASGSSSSG
jgi:predicted nucleotide-binding protein